MSEPLPERVRLEVSPDQVCEKCSALVMDMDDHLAWHTWDVVRTVDRISVLHRDVDELSNRVSALERDKSPRSSEGWAVRGGPSAGEGLA